MAQLPDLVNSGTSTRAAFYRESFDFALASSEKKPLKFLALYQTDFEDSLATKNFSDGVRQGSDMFPKAWATPENGEFDARNYKLLPRGLENVGVTENASFPVS
jgi:hypothetical protein